jgi:hypothetical protein
VPPEDQQALNRLSVAVFGQEHLLTLSVVFLGADRALTLHELTERMGIRNASSLQAPMRRLIAGGFIAPADRLWSDRAKRYERCDSHYWGLIDELYRRASAGNTLFD